MTHDRGQQIQQRLDRLHLSDRDFERRTGVERKTLRRAINEGDRTRESTWLRIERALDQLEARIHGEPTPAVATTPDVRPGDPHVFTITGERGGDIKVVVSGHIDDVQQLAEAVRRILREDDETPDSGN